MAISCSFSWGSFPGSVGNVRVISWADGRAVFSPGVADVDSASAAPMCRRTEAVRWRPFPVRRAGPRPAEAVGRLQAVVSLRNDFRFDIEWIDPIAKVGRLGCKSNVESRSLPVESRCCVPERLRCDRNFAKFAINGCCRAYSGVRFRRLDAVCCGPLCENDGYETFGDDRLLVRGGTDARFGDGELRV